MERDAFDFGIRLKERREQKRLSQEELARRIGVSKGTIYRYENNLQEPTKTNLVRLAQVLGTSLDDLVGLERDPLVELCGRLTDAQKQALSDWVSAFLE